MTPEKKAKFCFFLPDLIMTSSATFFGVISGLIINLILINRNTYFVIFPILLIFFEFLGVILLVLWALVGMDKRKGIKLEDLNNTVGAKRFLELLDSKYKKEIRFKKLFGLTFLYILPLIFVIFVPLLKNNSFLGNPNLSKVDHFLISFNLELEFNNRLKRTILKLKNQAKHLKVAPILFFSDQRPDFKNFDGLKLLNIDHVLKASQIGWEINITPGIERKRFYSVLIFPKDGTPTFYTTLDGIIEDTKAPKPPMSIDIKEISTANKHSMFVSWVKSESKDVEWYEIAYMKQKDKKKLKKKIITLSKDRTFYKIDFDKSGIYELHLVAIDSFNNRSAPIIKKTVTGTKRNRKGA